ncbi:MAG TPA: class I SAM-dependent methyltransferase [Candidatus Saccharimonadales bacterium]|nr:class I SAM-dependent methyltransferase [Candidatus Saccharimonadales bacterium]
MAQQAQDTSKQHKKADQYNDPSYNYLHYWDGRDYEHAAEEVAIQRLLKGKHFGKAVDIGGGYGRLCLLLEKYADKVVLAEPSQQQLDIAKDFLKGHDEIERKLVQASDLEMPDGSVDLITMVRVMHHLPDPTPELAEIARVLSDDGYAIIEMANYAHARNRLRHLIRGSKLPVRPVDIRSAQNKKKDEVPFVNHNPHTMMRQLSHAGLRVERILSVSNLRSPRLKQMLSVNTMINIEKALQVPLAPMFFGPSIFFLVRKVD